MAIQWKTSDNGRISMVYKSGWIPKPNKETESCLCLYHESLISSISDNENSDLGSKVFRNLKREYKI